MHNPKSYLPGCPQLAASAEEKKRVSREVTEGKRTPGSEIQRLHCFPRRPQLGGEGCAAAAAGKCV